MRIALLSLAVVLLALSLCAAGYAQDDEPSKLGIRVGVSGPLTSLDRQKTAKSWSIIGLDYTLRATETGRPSLQLGMNLREAIGGNGGSALTLSGAKFWWKDPAKENSLYFTAGLGISKLHWFGSNSTKPVGVAAVGYDIKNAFFVEAGLFVAPSFNSAGAGASVNMTGISLTVGTRKLF